MVDRFSPKEDTWVRFLVPPHLKYKNPASQSGIFVFLVETRNRRVFKNSNCFEFLKPRLGGGTEPVHLCTCEVTVERIPSTPATEQTKGLQKEIFHLFSCGKVIEGYFKNPTAWSFKNPGSEELLSLCARAHARSDGERGFPYPPQK